MNDHEVAVYHSIHSVASAISHICLFFVAGVLFMHSLLLKIGQACMPTLQRASQVLPFAVHVLAHLKKVTKKVTQPSTDKGSIAPQTACATIHATW